MNCDSIRNRLSPYLDGELDSSLRSIIRSHLENCPDCSLYYEELKNLNDDLYSLLEPESSGSDDFTDTVLTSAKQEFGDSTRQNKNNTGTFLADALRPGVAAATLTIGLIAGTYLGFGFMEALEIQEPTTPDSTSAVLSEQQSSIDRPEVTPVGSYTDAYFELAEADASSGRP